MIRDIVIFGFVMYETWNKSGWDISGLYKLIVATIISACITFFIEVGCIAIETGIKMILERKGGDNK